MSTLQPLDTLVAPPAAPPPRAVRAAADPVTLLVAGVGLGMLSHTLLWESAWGLNAGVWTAHLVLVLLLLGRRYGVELRAERRWLLGAALFFSAALAWRDSSTLAALNLLAVLVVLALSAYGSSPAALHRAGVGDYLLALGAAALNAAVGAAVLLLREVRWQAIPGIESSPRVVAVLRGALLAAPLLLLFGVLFVAADPVFESALVRLLSWRAEELVPALLWIAFWGWISVGFLRQALGEPAPAPSVAGRLPLSLGAIEALTVLGLLNLLFGAFVAVQLGYFFGGGGHVAATAGMSYAEYARRGFFELVAVAALLLPVLLVMDARVRRERPAESRRFRLLAGTLIALLFVVMASALQRMRLYQGEFGLTELRLYTTVFMLWLGQVFLWLVATVLRGRRERFAWGALVCGLATLALLNALNPDLLIVRTNLRHAGAASRFDASYLSTLSRDAVPGLVEALPALGPQDRCQLARDLLGTSESRLREETDWRSWNWGVARATRIMREKEVELRALAC